MDGVGEWATTSVAIGRGKDLQYPQGDSFPHSLGLFYSAFTYYTGFKVNSGEYKVMGLAPYGEPKYAQLILDNLIDLKADGTFRLDQDYFDYCTGLTMTNERFDAVRRSRCASPRSLLTQFHMDMAASIQAVTEEIVLRLARSLAARPGCDESVPCGRRRAQLRGQRQDTARRRFSRTSGSSRRPGDAGGAVGAALAAYHLHLGQAARGVDARDGMEGSYLGPGFDQSRGRSRLGGGRAFTVCRRASLLDARPRRLPTARRSAGSRAEWSSVRAPWARARSSAIRARPSMQKMLNLKVKYRESSALCTRRAARRRRRWFELDRQPVHAARRRRRGASAARMTEAEQALFGIEKLNVPRSDIPAVTHVDYSARIQTVARRNQSALSTRLIGGSRQ